MRTKGLLLLICTIFFLPKLATLGIRLSDSNIYFYTAYELLHGNILYKDIFFTNFPFLPYISMLYFVLSFGHLPLYYLTSSIEAIGTGCLLFIIVKQQYRQTAPALVTVCLYLFSFIVLSTSDHQTGVFTASFFAVLGYFLVVKKQYLWAGISLAIMLMTKAYFLPVYIALLFSVFFERGEKSTMLRSFHFTQTVKILAGTAISMLIILLPSLLFARNDLLHDVFGYSLTRSQGLSKINILWFFVQHDFLLVCLGLYTLWTIRKNLFLGLLTIFGLIFFVMYRDVYYLYLNFLVPFLCLILPEVLEKTKRFPSQKLLIATFLIFFLGSNYLLYLTRYATLGRIPDITPLTNAIQKNHPAVLYGMNDITPALAYLTKTPLLNNIIDTNENIFLKGYLNSKTLTNDAIQKHAIIIAHGASYLDQGIDDPLVGGIFESSRIRQACKLLVKTPVKTEGIENEITLFSCQ